jgi:hypothetical protein
MRSQSPWGRIAMLAAIRPRQAPPGHDFAANLLRIDADAICPKCMQWVTPRDIVRRTAFGLIQHESCSVVVERTPTSDHV